MFESGTLQEKYQQQIHHLNMLISVVCYEKYHKFNSLEQQKIISPVGEFTFEIDGEWKHKLLNGLDDIGITMQYEDLITEYEKHRPSYWQ